MTAVIALTDEERDEVQQLLLDIVYPDADDIILRAEDYNRDLLFEALAKLELSAQ